MTSTPAPPLYRYATSAAVSTRFHTPQPSSWPANQNGLVRSSLPKRKLNPATGVPAAPVVAVPPSTARLTLVPV